MGIEEFIHLFRWLYVPLTDTTLYRYLNFKMYLSDVEYVKWKFEKELGQKLNLDNPQTFNEKLQWLKLYDQNDQYTRLVDKYAVREYVREVIGREYLIPLLGVWDRPEDIDFELLPEQFVLKTNHDSGGVLICKDKTQLNRKEAVRFLKKRMRFNSYWQSREWPYKNVKKKIIAEQYMVDGNSKELRDYKFFCMNGKVKCFKVDFDRFTRHRANYYTRNGELLLFGETFYPPDFDKESSQPECLKEMVIIAEKLSCSIPFLRVDLYCVDGRIYVGELTFFPSGGFGPFEPAEADKWLGDALVLPIKA